MSLVLAVRITPLSGAEPLFGTAVRVNVPGGGGDVTVKLKLVCLVTPPPVAVTVIGKVPIVAEPEALIVTLLAQSVEHGFGEKFMVTPDGWPEAENVSEVWSPEVLVAATDWLTEPPCCTDLAPPFVKVKSKTGGGGFTVTLQVSGNPLLVTVTV